MDLEKIKIAYQNWLETKPFSINSHFKKYFTNFLGKNDFKMAECLIYIFPLHIWMRKFNTEEI